MGKDGRQFQEMSGLNSSQKQEVEKVVEKSIKDTLESQGVLAQDDTVTVDIDDLGAVAYEVDKTVDAGFETVENALEYITKAVINEIDSVLSDQLDTISDEIKEELDSQIVAFKESGDLFKNK